MQIYGYVDTPPSYFWEKQRFLYVLFMDAGKYVWKKEGAIDVKSGSDLGDWVNLTNFYLINNIITEIIFGIPKCSHIPFSPFYFKYRWMQSHKLIPFIRIFALFSAVATIAFLMGYTVIYLIITFSRKGSSK